MAFKFPWQDKEPVKREDKGEFCCSVCGACYPTAAGAAACEAGHAEEERRRKAAEDAEKLKGEEETKLGGELALEEEVAQFELGVFGEGQDREKYLQGLVDKGITLTATQWAELDEIKQERGWE